MFDIGSSELLLIAIVALVVIGPKDLPRVLRTVGQWIGKARQMSGHFRTGLEAMAREAEIEEMEKKWAEQNARIMAEHPPVSIGEMRPLTPEETQEPAPPPAVEAEPSRPAGETEA